MRNILIAVGITGFVIALFIFGYNALSMHIFNRTDCEQFNIDNVEVRTGIDIPSVVDFACSCEGNQKETSFTLDTDKVDLLQYIKRNNFEVQESVYQKQGETNKTKWNATLNPVSAVLNIKIEYKDKEE